MREHSRGYLWTKEEIAYLSSEYGKSSCREIAEKMGRTMQSIYCKAYSLGLKAPETHERSPFSLDPLNGPPAREVWCRKTNGEYYCRGCGRTRASSPAQNCSEKSHWRRYANNRVSRLAAKYKVSKTVIVEAWQKPCQICGSTRKVELDHNHRTGEIRGSLCHRCNLMIGLIEANLEHFRELLVYLNRWLSKETAQRFPLAQP